KSNQILGDQPYNVARRSPMMLMPGAESENSACSASSFFCAYSETGYWSDRSSTIGLGFEPYTLHDEAKRNRRTPARAARRAISMVPSKFTRCVNSGFRSHDGSFDSAAR